MERVTFIVEQSERRIAALLNPDHLEVRRHAGVRARRLPSGDLARPSDSDDALVFTGGGCTELTLRLLFDIGVSGSTGPPPTDVRELTAPLWALSENLVESEGRRRPPLVRFVWGKTWNVPGVVVEVAERLERFEPVGKPTRSWLTLRLRRVITDEAAASTGPAEPRALPAAALEAVTSEAAVHTLSGVEAGPAERLDSLAARYYGNPAWWRVIAEINRIEDPENVPAGTELRLPPAEALLAGDGPDRPRGGADRTGLGEGWA